MKKSHTLAAIWNSFHEGKSVFELANEFDMEIKQIEEYLRDYLNFRDAKMNRKLKKTQAKRK